MGALLLDMDGVILDGPRTLPGIYDAATEDAIDDLGLEPTPDQREALGTHVESTVVNVCSRLDVDPSTFLELKHAHACTRSHECIRKGERGIYDDVDVLRKLGERVPLALVSNNRHATVQFVAEFLDAPFAAVQGRKPVPEAFSRRKPDPYYIQLTLDRLGIDAGQYVGDRATDVEAAIAAGLEPIFIRRSHNRDVPTPEGTTHEIESLQELPAILEHS